MIRCSSLLQSKNRLSQVFCSTLPAYIKIWWFLWISSGTRSIGGLRQSYDAIKIQQSSSQLIWSVLYPRICSHRWSYNAIKIQFIWSVLYPRICSQLWSYNRSRSSSSQLILAVSQNLQSALVLQCNQDLVCPREFIIVYREISGHTLGIKYQILVIQMMFQ